MPSIIHLPLNEESRESSRARQTGNILSLNGGPQGDAHEGGESAAGEEKRAAADGSAAAQAAIDGRLHRNPFALLDEEFDLESQRLRSREAFWLSIIGHALLIILFIVALPKLAKQTVLTPLQQMLLDRQLTMVELPPAPKPEVKPNTDRISDQDRVASLRHPTPDAKTLRELRDSRIAEQQRAQSPKPVTQAAQPAAPAMRASEPAQQHGGGAQALQELAENGQPRASGANPFETPLSAGSQIQQAMKATAANRAGGSVGDYGDIPSPPNTKLHSNLDILSDTMGVDFGPYLARVIDEIRRNWYTLIPEEARAPLLKQGKVSIQFVIEKNGGVTGMRVLLPSGDVALDRAAWGGITESNPFQPLPGEFKGPYLALACTFYYNPERNDLR